MQPLSTSQFMSSAMALCLITDRVVEAAGEIGEPEEDSIPRKPRGRSIRLFRRKSAG